MTGRLWNLTLAGFRSALAKGLGRAALHLEQGPPSAAYVAELVEACFEPAWFAGDEEHTEWVVPWR